MVDFVNSWSILSILGQFCRFWSILPFYVAHVRRYVSILVNFYHFHQFFSLRWFALNFIDFVEFCSIFINFHLTFVHICRYQSSSTTKYSLNKPWIFRSGWSGYFWIMEPTKRRWSKRLIVPWISWTVTASEHANTSNWTNKRGKIVAVPMSRTVDHQLHPQLWMLWMIQDSWLRVLELPALPGKYFNSFRHTKSTSLYRSFCNYFQ